MKHFLFSLLLLLPLCSYSQKQGQARLDSLLAELPKITEDTNGVELLDAIALVSIRIRSEDALRYAQKELDLALKIGYKRGAAMAYNDMGNYYLNSGDYSRALENFFKTLSIDEELGLKRGIGSVTGNIGIVYEQEKNYPKALEYHFKSLNIAKEMGDTIRMQGALSNIGNTYDEQGNHKEALIYDIQSLELAKVLNDSEKIIRQLGNTGNVYSSLHEYGLALSYAQQALRLATQIGDKRSMAINLGNIGETHLSVATDSAFSKPDSLLPMGKPANLAKAVEYLSRGIDLCLEMGYIGPITEFGPAISQAYALQGNYKAALERYQQYTAVKDSLFNMEQTVKISGLETQRALELKDKDIQIDQLAVAKKRNERVLFIAGILLLLAVMGILFRNYRRQQQSNILLSAEKKRSDDLLLNILPAEVAEELKDKGSSGARHYDEVSVLFTDFVDFTGTAETMSPQALVQELHQCFTAFDAIVERNGLEKIKTIGDAYMAVCGLPLTDSRHATKTVQAAIEMRDFITERKTRDLGFEIRIGINSGPVIAGIVGVKKFAYDIWGDTVNTAARMEQNSETGKVNISQSTYELVKEHFTCISRGKLLAKNKGDIEMYFVS